MTWGRAAGHVSRVPRTALAAVLLGVWAGVAAGTTVAAAATPTATAMATGTATGDAAEGCPPSGVTVVVDFGELAADPAEALRTACDPDVADERAYTSIEDAGFDLEDATREPGFLCRVAGVPTTDPCVKAAPADAYWGLWWADGEGGDWVYASQGAGTLRTPEGGLLGLAWHQGAGESSPPSLAPDEVVPGGADVSAPQPGAAEEPEDGSLPLWVPASALAALLAAGVLVTRRRGRA
ncbi:hypothetical protein [Nocardioides campestrisoli]|uniref:hypothetical protein n=1 Tax=Nocardioides campestrisoli TaxID=2736757 RepID=UPI0015E64870|nr:hypothetical protein [Nocardioides campestrisoli]